MTHPTTAYEEAFPSEETNRTFVIAEAGVNHNGEIERALDLVRVAADAGADAVKFQTFQANELVTITAPKAIYQKESTGEGSQVEMLQALELPLDDFQRIRTCCDHYGIEFLSTPFDDQSLAFLIDTLEMGRVKVSSGDLTNAPFLLQVARTGRPVILSTGMSWMGEIEDALGVLAYGIMEARARDGRTSNRSPSRRAFRDALVQPEVQPALQARVTLLQCTTQYPAPDHAIHLRSMDTLRQAFGLPTGFSDHSTGIAIPIAAAARGAHVVEKHFTLDRDLDGPDHSASLEPDELVDMVHAIRRVEASLGRAQKRPDPVEVANRTVARRVLVAANDLQAGETFSADMIAVKRAGEGVAPVEYWSYLDATVSRDYDEGEPLDPF